MQSQPMNAELSMTNAGLTLMNAVLFTFVKLAPNNSLHKLVFDGIFILLLEAHLHWTYNNHIASSITQLRSVHRKNL